MAIRMSAKTVVASSKWTPQLAPSVRRIFELYAYHGLTLDALLKRLAAEGIIYRQSMPKFNRSSVHAILRDRSYLGEVEFRKQWYPGKQTPLVDRETWNRVQALMGGHVYQSHEMTYAGELMQCRRLRPSDHRRTQDQVDEHRRATLHLLPLHLLQRGRPSAHARDGSSS